MGLAARRSRVEIWTDILKEVQEAAENKPPSRIQTRVNLPYNRFWRHIETLDALGLLEREPLRTTTAGERFLEDAANLRALLRKAPDMDPL